MKSIAIIPARGGSKSIPYKNIKLLNGKHLIGYNIEEALKSSLIDRVIVSTDDTKIKEVSKLYGAEVIDRPTEFATDTASSESALLYTLEYLNKTENYIPDILVFLQCTSPLTITEDIDNTIKALIKDKADSALAVTDFDYFLWGKDENGNAIGLNHDKSYRQMRQERRGKQFLETGAVYVMKVEGFLKSKFRFFGKTTFSVMPAERVLEIDEPMDFIKAEIIMRGIC